jgi:hypothetical protein
VFTLLILLAAIPIALAVELLRDLARWRRVDLPTKNRIRAGVGAALIMICLALWADGYAALMPPIGGVALAGVAAFGLLWLVVGVHGSTRGASLDFMSFVWWGVGLVGCVAVLLFKGMIQWPSWLT